jgi:hypothetical protein
MESVIIQSTNCIQVSGTQGTFTNFGYMVTEPVDAGLFVAAGAPVDVSGWTITFRVKVNVTDPDSAAIYKVTWTIEDGTDGVVQAFVSAELSASMTPQNYWWSMVAVIGEGADPQELFSGVFTLFPGP